MLNNYFLPSYDVQEEITYKNSIVIAVIVLV